MQTTFQRVLSSLKPVRNRQPEAVQVLAQAAETFLVRKTDPLSEDLVRHERRVGEHLYDVTGDERAAALGFFHDVKDYTRLAEEWDAFVREFRRRPANTRLTPEQTACLLPIPDLFSPESFRRFQVLQKLDRSDGSSDRSILEKKSDYAQLVGGLQGEALARTMCLADLARLDRQALAGIYRGLKLTPDRVLTAYAPAIWYTYLPLAYRAGLVFSYTGLEDNPFRQIREDLAIVVALGLNQSAYERVSSIMGRWHSPLERLMLEITDLLRSPYMKNLQALLDEDQPFEGGTKAVSALTIKAVADQELVQRMGDSITEQGLREGNFDTLRCRLRLKRNVAPSQALQLIANNLQKKGYEIVPVLIKETVDGRIVEKTYVGPHQRKSGGWYLIVQKNGFYVEFQAQPPEMLEQMERGKRYHEGYKAELLNSHFDLGKNDQACLPPAILRLVEAHALVTTAHIKTEQRHTLRQKRGRPLSVPTSVAYELSGLPIEGRTPVFTDSTVADVIANKLGLLDHRVTVGVNGEELPVNQWDRPVTLRDTIEIRVDRVLNVVSPESEKQKRDERQKETEGDGKKKKERNDNGAPVFAISRKEAQTLLPAVNTLAAQSQLFAVVFEAEYQRRQSEQRREK